MNLPIKKGLFCACVLFLILFSLRLSYGFFFPGRAADQFGFPAIGDSFTFDRKNYASAKFKGESPGTGFDQKYEKVGSLKNSSHDFEKDLMKIRNVISSYSGMIQYEHAAGLIGNRQVNLGIGVLPENFDPFLAEVRQIGRLLSVQIEKHDKTNEYQKLKAKRGSLEKARDSLAKLKETGVAGAKVDELINLEDRILALEQEIQALGVNLGEFDENNEFCTVKYSLIERREQILEIPLPTRIKVALEWTIKYGFVLTGFITLCLLIVSLFEYIQGNRTGRKSSD